MNLAKSATLHPHLLDEEARVVENAIRLAIDSILNVLYGVNSARTREYQRMVGDRDKEIQRLERRLREIEHELQVLRRQGCTRGHLAGPQTCTEPSGSEPDCLDPEVTAGQQDCEMSLSFGLFARPSSHVSSQSHESALPSSPSRMGLDQTYTSRSSEASGLSEVARNLTTSPSGLVVKEEPYDIDTVMIKWEMSERRLGEQQEIRDSPCHDKEGPSITKSREKTKINEKPQAEPEDHHVAEGDNLRNRKKPVPMSELPEEAQRLKRAAWRAASRRYYARKVARQQADPSHSSPFPHIPASHYSPPMSLLERRRRSLISELPEESQMLQREAWRAASKRYYARKIARHRPEYGHLLQHKEASGETPKTGGSHTNSGGIMCS
ncbi:uncharacterized protein LOC114842719 [Betta splendens]|uniref:Uncharacterized protein LOC114842719 n=1 Tax=Betta splendens TaxID=158456 RepID=A0A6P7KP92_BETSP|nr:uncharacterized protein LOC114842719 [Betta splendens]XP_028984354.1 uncharacterized protein LOC114842719 [Betta splendens]